MSNHITTEELLVQETLDTIEKNPIIYKYSGMLACKSILEDSTIGFSNPSEFNDPFDCYDPLLSFDNIPDNFLENLIESQSSFTREYKDILKEQLQSNLFTKDQVLELFIGKGGSNQMAKKNIGISCFTSKADNLLMWSHYAASHSGVCLCFQTNILMSSLATTIGAVSINEVEYVNEFITYDFFKDQAMSLRKWIGTKSKEWAYEEELRILLPFILESSSSTRAYVPFAKEALRAIYIGFKAKNEDVDSIIEICRSRYDSKIQLYKTIADTKGFRLGFQEINY